MGLYSKAYVGLIHSTSKVIFFLSLIFTSLICFEQKYWIHNFLSSEISTEVFWINKYTYLSINTPKLTLYISMYRYSYFFDHNKQQNGFWMRKFHIETTDLITLPMNIRMLFVTKTWPCSNLWELQHQSNIILHFFSSPF